MKRGWGAGVCIRRFSGLTSLLKAVSLTAGCLGPCRVKDGDPATFLDNLCLTTFVTKTNKQRNQPTKQNFLKHLNKFFCVTIRVQYLLSFQRLWLHLLNSLPSCIYVYKHIRIYIYIYTVIRLIPPRIPPAKTLILRVS